MSALADLEARVRKLEARDDDTAGLRLRLQMALDRAEVAAADEREARGILNRISGTLCDAGDIPVEPYPEAVAMLLKQRDAARKERDAAVSALESLAGKGVPEVTTGQPFAVEHTSEGKWWLMFRGSFCVASYSNGIDADAVCFHLNRHWPAAPREEKPSQIMKHLREQVSARDAEIERLRAARESDLEAMRASYERDLFEARRECAIRHGHAPPASASPAGEAPCADCRDGWFECPVHRAKETPFVVSKTLGTAPTPASSSTEVPRQSSRGAEGPKSPAPSPPPAAPDVDEVVREMRISCEWIDGHAVIRVGNVELRTNPDGTNRYAVTRVIANLLTAARAEVRREALEEAAKECDGLRDANYGRDQAWGVAEACARRIRALGKGDGHG